MNVDIYVKKGESSLDESPFYEMRSKILKDKVSSLNKAKAEGREQVKIEIAKNF